MKLLAAAGADPHALAPRGEGAAFLAIPKLAWRLSPELHGCHVAAFDMLASESLDVSRELPCGDTLAMRCVLRGSHEGLLALDRLGADLVSFNSRGRSPMELALLGEDRDGKPGPDHRRCAEILRVVAEREALKLASRRAPSASASRI